MGEVFMTKLKEIIYNRLPMQVLSYITRQRNSDKIYGAKLAEILNISQGGTSIFLKQLQHAGILHSRNVGRTIIYDIDTDNPVFKYFRIFDNLLEIAVLVGQIKNYSRKIILFGSCARGEDNSDSDIDLFIIADSDYHEIIRKAISDFHAEREINPVIADSLELIEIEQNDKVFLDETYKGIELWGGKRE
jgi:predicted nucleotidyltransferase